AARLITPDDDLVGGAAVADVFHTEIELIGVEVRLPVVGLRTAGDRRGRDFGLSDGVVPVLDAQTLIAQRVLGVRDVTAGQDAAGGGPHALIDDDAAVRAPPRRGGRGHGGIRAEADDDEIGGHASGAGFDGLDGGGTGEGRGVGLLEEGHTVLLV